MKGSLISTAISQLYLPDEYRGINGTIRDDGDKASINTIGLKEKSGDILNKDASLPKVDSFKSDVKAYIDRIVSNAKEKVSKELALTIAMSNAKIAPNNSSTVEKLQMPKYENVENGSSVDAGPSAVNIRNDEELGKLTSPSDPQQKTDFQSQRVTDNDGRHVDILNPEEPSQKKGFNIKDVRSYVENIVIQAKARFLAEETKAIIMPTVEMKPTLNSAVENLKMPKDVYEEKGNSITVGIGSSSLNMATDGNPGKNPSLKEPKQEAYIDLKSVQSYIGDIITKAQNIVRKESEIEDAIPTAKIFPNISSTVENLQKPYDVEVENANDASFGSTAVANDVKQEAYIDLKSVQSYIGGIITKAQNIVRKESEIADAIPTAKIFPNISSTVENLQKPYDVEVENANDASIGSTDVVNDVNHGNIASPNGSSQKTDFHMTNGSNSQIWNTMNQRKSDSTPDFNRKDVKMYIDHVIIQAKQRFIKENEMAIAISSAKISPDSSSSVCSLKAPTDIHVVTKAAKINPPPKDDVSVCKTKYLPVLKKSDFDLSDVRAYVQDVILLAKKSVIKEEEIAIANKFPSINSTVVDVQISRDTQGQNRKAIDNGFELSVYKKDDLGTRRKIANPPKIDFHMTTVNESQHDTFQNTRASVQKTDVSIKDVKSYIGHVVLQAKKQIMKEKIMTTAATTTGKTENHNPTPVMNKANLNRYLTSGTENNSSFKHFACDDKQDVIIENRFGSTSVNSDNDGERGNIFTPRQPTQEKHIQMKDVRSYVQQVIIQTQNKLIHENNKPRPMSFTEKDESFGHSSVLNDILQPQTGGLPKNVPKVNDNAIGTNVGSSSVKNDDIGKPENILAASFESSTEITCTSQKPGNIESHKDPSEKTDFKSKDVKSYVAEIITQAQQKLIKENSMTTGMPDTESNKKVRESVVFTDKLQAQAGTYEGIGNDIEAGDKHQFGNVANISSGRNTSEKLHIDIDKVVCYIKQLLTDDQKMAIYEYCRTNAMGPDVGNRSDFTVWIPLEQNTLKGNKTPIESEIGSLTESILSCIQQIIDDAKKKIFSGNCMAMEMFKMGTNGTIESSFDAKLKNPIENDIGKPVWRRSSAGDTREMHWNNCDYLTLDKEESCTERVCTHVENQITEDNKLICRMSGEGDRIKLKNMGSNKNHENSLYAETSQDENMDKESAKSHPMKMMENMEAFHDGDRWSTQCTNEMPRLESHSMATKHGVHDNDIVNDKAIQLSGRNGPVGKLKLDKCTAEDDIAAGARISSDDSIKDNHAISNPKMYSTTSLELKEGIQQSKTMEQILSCMENLLVEVERITTKGNEVKHNYSAMTPTSSSTYMLHDVKENKSPTSSRTLNVFPSLDGKENESTKCIDTVIALSRIDDETSEKPSCLEESRFSDNSTTETLCQPVKRYVPCIMDKNKDKISPGGSGKRIAVPKTATLPILPCKTKTSIDDKRISKPLKLSDKGALSTLTRLPSKPTIMRTSVVTKVKPTETASVRQKEGKEKMQSDKVGKLTETLPNPGEHVDRKHDKWKNRSQCKVNKIGEIVGLKENMKGQYQSQKRPVSVRKSAAMSVVQAMLMEKTENHVQSGVTDDQFVTSSENGRLSDDILPKPCSTDIHSDNQEIEKQIEPWEPTDQKTFKKGRIKSTFSPPPENDRSKCQKTCSTDKIEEKPLMPKLRMRQNGKGVKQCSQNTERNEAKLESIGKYPEPANSFSVVSESVSETIPLESRPDSNPPKSQPNLTIICNDNHGTGAQTECQESADEKELPNSSIFLYDGQFISAIFIEGKRKRPSKSISNRRRKDSEQQTEHQECIVLTGQMQGNGSIVNPATISHIPQNCEGSIVIEPKKLASETNNSEQQTEHQERTVLTDQKQDNGRSVNPETISHIHQKSESSTVIESKKLESETNISDQQIEHQELTALSNQDQGNGKIVIRDTISLIPQKSESSTVIEPRKHASETNKLGVSSEENVKDRKIQQKKQIKIKSSELRPGKAVPLKGPLPPIRNRIAQDVKGEATPNRKLRIIVDNSIQNRPPWNASPKLRLEWEEARLNRHKKINTGGDESKFDDILRASKFSKYKPLPDISKLGDIKTKTGRLKDIMSKDRESDNRNNLPKLSVLPSINTGAQNKVLTGNTTIISKVTRRANSSDISGAKTNVLRRKARGLSTSPISHEIRYTVQDNEFEIRMEVGGSTGTNKNENNRSESRYTVPVSSLSNFRETVHSVSENTISSESNISLKTSRDVPSPSISSASPVSAVSPDSRNRSRHVY